jgi:hypothetical protein
MQQVELAAAVLSTFPKPTQANVLGKVVYSNGLWKITSLGRIILALLEK